MRWKLTEPHYLNVPGTRWEQIMTDRSTGRPIRKVYEVPRYLHPEAPDDWTHGDKRSGDGYIVVCHEGKGLPDDIEFIGDPTPGMLPIDEEAQQLSAKFSKQWTPTTGTDEQAQMESFQQKLLNGMMDQMSMAQTAAASVPAGQGMEKFMEMFAAMMQQQTQILLAISGKLADAEFTKAGAALGENVIVDDAEPLDAAEPTEAELAEAAEAAQAREAALAERATQHALSGRR